MTALIEQLQIHSAVVRGMLGLLLHLSPPVSLEPAPGSLVPRGCLQLPSMRLILAGAAGPDDPALAAAEEVARSMHADILVLSIRPHHATRALRYDVIFVEQDRTELASDLLFWTLPDHMPALVQCGARARRDHRPDHANPARNDAVRECSGARRRGCPRHRRTAARIVGRGLSSGG